jgi:dTMP kinase
VSAPSGVFVVFEGGDGVGKSTQVQLLCAALVDAGREVLRTFEPGDSAVGAEIRRLVLDPATGDLDPRAEALLYAADKAQHLHAVVRPALARGAVVVCDRYVDSMLAYQGAGRVLAETEVEQVARWATQDLRPDLTVLLDVDPRRAVHTKVAKDRLEAAGETFHERARASFLALAAREPATYLVLDARRSIDDLADAVAARVLTLLGQGTGAELSDTSGRMRP